MTGVSRIALSLLVLAFVSGRAGASDFQTEGRALAGALEHYRQIAASGGWLRLPDGPILEKGVTGKRVVLLRQRLAAEGELGMPDGVSNAFDAGLVRAVANFQSRHGLDVDGRAGRRTLEAMNIPVEVRIRQIEMARVHLEEDAADRPSDRIEVNIPAEELAVYEGGIRQMSMRVIVGSPSHPTPVFNGRIGSIQFNPPWNVPVSITRNEIIPRLKREPAYLRKNDIRIVDRPEDPYGESVDWRSKSAPRYVPLRQQPGPLNSLGQVKFDIPNPYSIYLHDTPAKSLFARSERALSHGCIRVERPFDLAAYLLRENLSVDPKLMERSLASGETVTIALSRPMPVYIDYRTVQVDRDGAVKFFPDIYSQETSATKMASVGGCKPAA